MVYPLAVYGRGLGVISGVLALLAVWAIYAAVSRSLVSMLSGLGMTGVAPFGKYALILLAVFLGLGLVAGAFGSAVSITRYLREKEFVVVDE